MITDQFIMDDGGGHAGDHVHPFVAQKRLEMQARMEKRLKKRRKSDHEPLLANDALNLDGDAHILDLDGDLVSDDEDEDEDNDDDAGGPPQPPPGAKISALAESVK